MSATWRKSSHSGSGGGDCTEVAGTPDAVLIRDSKDPDGPKLTFTRAEWRTFTTALGTGALDLR